MKEGRRPGTGTRHSMRDVRHLSGYGLGWALTVALLAWAGLKLDEWLGTSPLMVLLFTFGGIAAGMVRLYTSAMAPPAQRETDTSRSGEEDG